MSASAFLDAMGVNTHVNNWGNGSSYEDFDKVRGALTYLGIQYIRDGVPIENTSFPRYEALAGAGYRFDFIVSAVDFNIAGSYEIDLKRLNAFAKDYAGSIAAIEGFNEVNTWTVHHDGRDSGTDLSLAHDLQGMLYDNLKASPLLSQIPVLNVTVGGLSVESAAGLGDLSAASDYGNWHIYFAHGEQPGRNIAAGVAAAKTFNPEDPVQITETGNYTAVHSTDHSPGGVSEIAQAKLNLNLLFDAAKAGVERTYLYELLDTGIEPDTTFGGSLGLFHGDGTPKPAATAIHNLREILADNGLKATGIPQEAPRISLSDLPPNSNTLLLQKADGRYDLVIWAEPDIWDEQNHTDLSAPTSYVTVTFDRPFGGVAVYDPLLGTNPVAQAGNTDSISVAITDHPIIIELSPPTAGSVGGGAPAGISLHGGAGADMMRGTEGSDSIFGQAGDDTLVGGSGNDMLDGGDGKDWLDLSAATGAAGVDLGRTSAQALVAGHGQATVLNIENVLGGRFDDSLTGSAAANVLMGGGGNDRLLGMDGNDTLLGGRGADTLEGGAGDDVFIGLDAGDLLDGGAGTDTLSMAKVNSRSWIYLDGTDEKGVAHANAYAAAGSVIVSVENLTGSAVGSDAFWGDAGANRLVGMGGNDLLYGKGGNDRLEGGDGNDILSGGAGADDLIGGAGADRFVFDVAPIASAADRITDFEAGLDKLVISRAAFGIAAGITPALIANAAPAAHGPGGVLLYDTAGGGAGGLFWDADGLGGAAAIQIARLSNAAPLSASDFLFVA
ncbi:calcium-binding protein [Pararoseomonas indoligenes]|uniref:Calcium-binding protein n=1 Tax=Roseomonas indoligenes TaxID=2820811 RepID=A0A940N6W8_9PROT|nr:calcium-binding protein [Pararoseomonas indoligenes]MBP0496235.1 calcium-binding protein [Pararoseomonas indoligenes]